MTEKQRRFRPEQKRAALGAIYSYVSAAVESGDAADEVDGAFQDELADGLILIGREIDAVDRLIEHRAKSEGPARPFGIVG